MIAQRNSSGTPATMRNIFGIIMIIICVGVGILFFCGFLTSTFPAGLDALGCRRSVYSLWPMAYLQTA